MTMMMFREQRMRALANGDQVRKQFRAQTTGDVTELYMYDVIDSWGGYWGISAKDVIESLIGAGDVLIHMNSPGGEATEALAIYSTLRQHPGKITMRVEGMAASAASVVMLGAAEVVIDPNAMVMIHDAWGYTGGPEADVRKYADTLGKISRNLASIYAAKGGGEADTWRAAMLAETWYVGQEAVDAGLVDTVVDFGDTAADGELIGADDEGELMSFARWDRSTIAAMYNQAPRVVVRSRPGEQAPAAVGVAAGAVTQTEVPLIPDMAAFRAALGGLKV